MWVWLQRWELSEVKWNEMKWKEGHSRAQKYSVLHIFCKCLLRTGHWLPRCGHTKMNNTWSSLSRTMYEYSLLVKRMATRSWSLASYWETVWPWASCLISLCLGFLICKMGIVSNIPQGIIVTVKWVNIWYSKHCWPYNKNSI